MHSQIDRLKTQEFDNGVHFSSLPQTGLNSTRVKCQQVTANSISFIQYNQSPELIINYKDNCV